MSKTLNPVFKHFLSTPYGEILCVQRIIPKIVPMSDPFEAEQCSSSTMLQMSKRKTNLKSKEIIENTTESYTVIIQYSEEMERAVAGVLNDVPNMKETNAVIIARADYTMMSQSFEHLFDWVINSECNPANLINQVRELCVANDYEAMFSIVSKYSSTLDRTFQDFTVQFSKLLLLLIIIHGEKNVDTFTPYHVVKNAFMYVCVIMLDHKKRFKNFIMDKVKKYRENTDLVDFEMKNQDKFDILDYVHIFGNSLLVVDLLKLKVVVEAFVRHRYNNKIGDEKFKAVLALQSEKNLFGLNPCLKNICGKMKARSWHVDRLSSPKDNMLNDAMDIFKQNSNGNKKARVSGATVKTTSININATVVHDSTSIYKSPHYKQRFKEFTDKSRTMTYIVNTELNCMGMESDEVYNLSKFFSNPDFNCIDKYLQPGFITQAYLDDCLQALVGFEMDKNPELDIYHGLQPKLPYLLYEKTQKPRDQFRCLITRCFCTGDPSIDSIFTEKRNPLYESLCKSEVQFELIIIPVCEPGHFFCVVVEQGNGVYVIDSLHSECNHLMDIIKGFGGFFKDVTIYPKVKDFEQAFDCNVSRQINVVCGFHTMINSICLATAARTTFMDEGNFCIKLWKMLLLSYKRKGIDESIKSFSMALKDKTLNPATIELMMRDNAVVYKNLYVTLKNSLKPEILSTISVRNEIIDTSTFYTNLWNEMASISKQLQQKQYPYGESKLFTDNKTQIPAILVLPCFTKWKNFLMTYVNLNCLATVQSSIIQYSLFSTVGIPVINLH